MTDAEQHALAEQLADYPRSLRTLAVAVMNTAGRIDQATDAAEVGRLLEAELVRAELALDALCVNTALRCLVGFLAVKTGVGPQRVLEEHFKAAPNEATWRTLLDGARREKGDPT